MGRRYWPGTEIEGDVRNITLGRLRGLRARFDQVETVVVICTIRDLKLASTRVTATRLAGGSSRNFHEQIRLTEACRDIWGANRVVSLWVHPDPIRPAVETQVTDRLELLRGDDLWQMAGPWKGGAGPVLAGQTWWAAGVYRPRAGISLLDVAAPRRLKMIPRRLEGCPKLNLRPVSYTHLTLPTNREV